MKEAKKKLKIAMIILAAGESSRMDALKQLLPWKDNTLLGHSIDQGLASNVDDVIVVLGANSKRIANSISTSKINIIENSEWTFGMGRSISYAMEFIEKGVVLYDAVLIALADQPLIDATHYNNLINVFIDDDKKIVATQLKKKAGVPAIFGSNYFKALSKLKHDIGAREIIATHSKELQIVSAGGRILDIDTMETYKELYSKYGRN